MDMRAAYLTIPLNAASRPLTTFATRSGCYQFTRVMFGLATAPATMARFAHMALDGQLWSDTLVYYDDILCGAATWPDYVHTTRSVLRCCRRAGIRLSFEKCHFA